MSKPLGVSLTLDERGLPRMRVNQSTRVENAVWDAVNEAIDAGWTPERFKNEVASAWVDKLKDDAKHAQAIFTS